MARPLRVVGAVGAITRLFSATFLPPALIAIIYDAPDTAVLGARVPHGLLVFIGCAALTYILGSALRRAGQSALAEPLRDRDAYLTVGIGWIALCLLGMLPFILSGVLTNPIDAFFETMSGMTTTGASVIAADLDTVPKSLMIWRALLQFIGGMGIIVLGVAVLAKLTQGGATLLQAEAPGPTLTRIAPRIARTARILWTVYGGMALLLFVLLFTVLLRHDLGLKQTIYEALLHTMTTISTGGFGAHSSSIAYFDDWVLEVILTIFMLASATNFTLHYSLLTGRGKALVRDPEWRFFMGTFVFVTLAITGMLAAAGQGIASSVRESTFTVASLISSTGLITADFGVWPDGAQLLLLLVMFTGATAGSTGGGLKHVRVLILMKLVRRQVIRGLHPRAVVPIRLAGRVIPEGTIMATVAFFFAYFAIWFAATLVLTSTDAVLSNPIDAASASISALANMGPGLGTVGPTQNFAALAPMSKVILALEEWFGRLEIFAALLIFTPETWRQ